MARLVDRSHPTSAKQRQNFKLRKELGDCGYAQRLQWQSARAQSLLQQAGRTQINGRVWNHPENLLLDSNGRVKIADFGIAKIVAAGGQETGMTASQQSLGTPNYMAPEQLEKPQEVDHRADIFSLGVLLYEMLTGEFPGHPARTARDAWGPHGRVGPVERIPQRRSGERSGSIVRTASKFP